MLLRFYRLSDKLGMVILKLGAAASDWLLDSAQWVTDMSGKTFARLIRRIGLLLMGILGILWYLLRQIGKVVRFFVMGVWRMITMLFNLIMRLLRISGRVSGGALQSSVKAGRAATTNIVTNTSQAMARRAAQRAAQDEIDVIIKEDPLKVQNRRLSFLVLILGAAVLGVVIWATDPNRTGDRLPVAIVPDNPLADANQPNDQATAVSDLVPLATAVPTAVPLPESIQVRGAIAYTSRERGQNDLWALNVGSGNPIRLTNDPADERDPEWNADGTRLAYAAHIDGNWDLYVYDTFQDETGRVTVEPSFQANPTWSPDGALLAYENYQNENLDIFAIPIDNSRAPIPITTHPAPDFSPAWSPDDGRKIAFVSLRDGNADIYVIDLDTTDITNITNTPTIDEDHPAWSPDGRSLAYSAREPLAISETIFVQSMDDLAADPQIIAVGSHPAWSPDGNSLSYTVDSTSGEQTNLFAITFGEARVPILISAVAFGTTAPTWTLQALPTGLVNGGGLPPAPQDDLYVEQTTTFDGDNFQLQSLGNVQVDTPYLSDAVNDAFDALRQATFEQSGIDFLGRLGDAMWLLDRPSDLGEAPRSWHRTGRAFALPRTAYLGLPPPIEVMRQDIGNQTYWRIFVRVDDASQRGQLGEPLRQIPWDFLSTDLGDVDAYNRGGRLRPEVPQGYYIDFTLLAHDYGWERVPAGSDWVGNERARNFWLFINDDDLRWCDAMLQLYSAGELINYNCAES